MRCFEFSLKFEMRMNLVSYFIIMVLSLPAVVSAVFADIITCASEVKVCDGTSGDDVIIGNKLNNIIRGLNGSDTLIGLEGNDNISGGERYDVLIGQEGNDRLLGGDGSDEILRDRRR